MYNVLMSAKVPKHYLLSPAEDQALRELIDAGYAFPAKTEIGVIRRMLLDAWKQTFPGVPFPSAPAEGENES